MANTRKLTVEIAGDSSGAVRAMGRVDSSGSSLSRKMGGVAKAIAGAFVVDRIIDFGASLITAAEDAEKVTRQTEAVIESTGKAANVTADQVGGLAEELSLMSGIDDELIQSGENVLLTFKNIRNEMGKGNDIFDQATEAALDMSVALDQDLQSSVTQIGKALNDPIAGMSALSRVGVTFSEDQKKVITSLAESGDLLGAQKIILEELTSEFGGSAEAQATASGKLRTAWDNVKETLGEKLLPIFEDVATWLAEHLPGAIAKAEEWFNKISDWCKDNEGVVRAMAIAVGVVLAGAMLVYAINAGLAAAATIAATWPIILAVAAIALIAAGLWYAYENWGWFRAGIDLAIQGVGYFIDGIGPVIKFLVSVAKAAQAAADAIASVFNAQDRFTGNGTGAAVADYMKVKGARAGGGPVSSGTWLVGEDGPELMTVGGNGYVTPNHMLGGGGTTVKVYVQGSVISERELAGIINRNTRRGTR